MRSDNLGDPSSSGWIDVAGPIINCSSLSITQFSRKTIRYAEILSESFKYTCMDGNPV
jgi:hypothetical protein